jgi:hypothetical protein
MFWLSEALIVFLFIQPSPVVALVLFLFTLLFTSTAWFANPSADADEHLADFPIDLSHR